MTIFYNYSHYDDLIKKRRALTDRNIRFMTFAAVLLIALIPAVLLYTILTGASSREFRRREDRYLENFRDEKIRQIQSRYDETLALLEKTADRAAAGILMSDSDESVNPRIELLREVNTSLTDVYYFDENRKPLGIHPLPDRTLTAVQAPLSDRIFSTPSGVVFLSLPDNRPVFCRFKKHFIDGKPAGYSAVLFDLSFLLPSLTVPEPFEIDLYNEDFELSGSSADKQTGVVTINDLTKRMLDGYTGVMNHEDRSHAYGFVRLGETALYISVSRDAGAAYRGGQTVSLVFFLLILFLSSWLTAWKLYKEILRFGESILVEETFSGDMKFFSRVKENLASLTEHTGVIEKLGNELKYLRNDISYIIEKIPDDEEEE